MGWLPGAFLFGIAGHGGVVSIRYGHWVILHDSSVWAGLMGPLMDR